MSYDVRGYHNNPLTEADLRGLAQADENYWRKRGHKVGPRLVAFALVLLDTLDTLHPPDAVCTCRTVEKLLPRPSCPVHGMNP